MSRSLEPSHGTQPINKTPSADENHVKFDENSEKKAFKAWPMVHNLERCWQKNNQNSSLNSVAVPSLLSTKVKGKGLL